MKYITNYNGTVKLPYQFNGAELIVWLNEHYPHSKYKVVEV